MALKNWNVPPLIAQWIEQLHNPHVGDHIKDNYRQMLQNVEEACKMEVDWFLASRKPKASAPKVAEKKPRKKG